jgi:hypothetical protein
MIPPDLGAILLVGAVVVAVMVVVEYVIPGASVEDVALALALVTGGAVGAWAARAIAPASLGALHPSKPVGFAIATVAIVAFLEKRYGVRPFRP